MRFGVGLAILGVGVVGLGWWARAEYATHMQEKLVHSAQEISAESIHGVLTQVEGRDIRVTGLADGQAEHDTLIAQFDAIRGRRVIIDDLEVLPVASPYNLSAIWADGALTAEGHVPTRAGRATLAAVGAEGLTMAAGAPDPNWSEAAAMAIAALRDLESGQIAISGRRMSVNGVARTPAEGEAIRAALDALPEGYQADMGLRYLDDGTPPSYSLGYSVVQGAWLEGKLPPGVAAPELADALGLAEIVDNATQGILGDDGRVPAALGLLAPWMAEVETMDIAVAPDGTDVSVGFGAGADLELLEAALRTDLASVADDVTLSVSEITAEGADGAQRSNSVTGLTEALRGGYWLPVADFDLTADGCAAQADAVLADNRIGFVTGSARLDGRARMGVNALAAVLGTCLRDAGLQAEIGGHTDSTGSAEGNLALSLARAEAVRTALLSRGVPEAALTAEGYGPSQPIADNETEEGRAANRRTAVRWVE